MNIEASLDLGEGSELLEAPTVTQSKFFSPAFNAAIFDGPLRIYFAQYQEAEALKLYFKLQEKLKVEKIELRGHLKATGFHMFVMLYPSTEIFFRSFPGKSKEMRIAQERLGKDMVIGINGAFQDADCDLIFSKLCGITTV